MGYARTLHRKRRRFVKCAAALAAIFLVGSSCRAQSKQASQQPELPWTQDFTKYPGLLDEFGRLIEKLQQNIR
jgi:hypothetical protein